MGTLPSKGQTDEVEAHIRALASAVHSDEHEDLFDHLYSCLSVLDAKSASLLSFNSILIAVFAIFMTQRLPGMAWVLANAGMVAVLVSAVLVLSVVWVFWSGTSDLADAHAHARHLLEVRRRRTLRYRIAWLLAVGSLGLLGLLLASRWQSGL